MAMPNTLTYYVTAIIVEVRFIVQAPRYVRKLKTQVIFLPICENYPPFEVVKKLHLDQLQIFAFAKH